MHTCLLVTSEGSNFMLWSLCPGILPGGKMQWWAAKLRIKQTTAWTCSKVRDLPARLPRVEKSRNILFYIYSSSLLFMYFWGNCMFVKHFSFNLIAQSMMSELKILLMVRRRQRYAARRHRWCGRRSRLVCPCQCCRLTMLILAARLKATAEEKVVLVLSSPIVGHQAVIAFVWGVDSAFDHRALPPWAVVEGASVPTPKFEQSGLPWVSRMVSQL